MAADIPRRTLVVANRTAGTRLLLEEVSRRARERPTRFTLLVPRVPRGLRAAQHDDWTLERALVLLERAARAPVEGYLATGETRSTPCAARWVAAASTTWSSRRCRRAGPSGCAATFRAACGGWACR